MRFCPWRSAVRTALANGEWPLLNPFMLCGDILAAAAQPAPYDPFNLIGMVIPMPPSLTFAAAMTFFLAGFGAFAFARALGCGELAALVAALMLALEAAGGLLLLGRFFERRRQRLLRPVVIFLFSRIRMQAR